jgi:hypothetical protein
MILDWDSLFGSGFRSSPDSWKCNTAGTVDGLSPLDTRDVCLIRMELAYLKRLDVKASLDLFGDVANL